MALQVLVFACPQIDKPAWTDSSLAYLRLVVLFPSYTYVNATVENIVDFSFFVQILKA